MSKAVTLTVTLSHAELKRALKSVGRKVVDRQGFEALLESPKFQKELVKDMKDMWMQGHDEDGGDALDMLFGKVTDWDL